MNVKDQQVNALRELIMAKQAFDRALTEFQKTLPVKVSDSRVALLVQHLPETDPRETTEQTLTEALFWAGIRLDIEEDALNMETPE